MRVREGKITDHWGVANLFSLMQQLDRGTLNETQFDQPTLQLGLRQAGTGPFDAKRVDTAAEGESVETPNKAAIL